MAPWGFNDEEDATTPPIDPDAGGPPPVLQAALASWPGWVGEQLNNQGYELQNNAWVSPTPSDQPSFSRNIDIFRDRFVDEVVAPAMDTYLYERLSDDEKFRYDYARRGEIYDDLTGEGRAPRNEREQLLLSHYLEGRTSAPTGEWLKAAAITGAAVLGGGLLFTPLGATFAAQTAVSEGVQKVPGFESLPGVAQKAAQYAPYFASPASGGVRAIAGRAAAGGAVTAAGGEIAEQAGLPAIAGELAALPVAALARGSVQGLVRTMTAGDAEIAAEGTSLFHGTIRAFARGIETDGVRPGTWMAADPKAAAQAAAAQRTYQNVFGRMQGRHFTPEDLEPVVLEFKATPETVTRVRNDLNKLQVSFRAQQALRPETEVTIEAAMRRFEVDPVPQGFKRFFFGTSGAVDSLPANAALSDSLSSAEIAARSHASKTGFLPRVMVVDAAEDAIAAGRGFTNLLDATKSRLVGEVPAGVRSFLESETGAVRLPGIVKPRGPKAGPFFAFDPVEDVLRRNMPTEIPRVLKGAEKVPGVRTVAEHIAPLETAVIKAERGRPVAQIMRGRIIYADNESNRAALNFFSWMGRNGELLGLTADGRATKVALTTGESTGKRAKQRLDDILEQTFMPEGRQPGLPDLGPKAGPGFSPKYAPTDEQKAALQELRDGFDRLRRTERAAGINTEKSTADYYARIILGDEPSTVIRGKGLRMTRGPQQAREYTTVREALAAGEDVANPLEALLTRFRVGAEGIADQWALTQLKGAAFKEGLKEPAEQTLRSLVEARTLPRAWNREIDKYLSTFEPSLFNEAIQLVRGTLVGGDLSMLFVQGTAMFYRDPPAWWRTSAYSLASLVKTPWSYYAKNEEVFDKMAKYGVGRVPSELMLSRTTGATLPGKLARGLGELPPFKQAQRAFETYTQVASAERWRVLEDVYTKRFGRELSDQEYRELASVVAKEVGYSIRAGSTRGEAALDSFILFAPRFATSFVGLFKDAMTPSLGIASHEARVQLGSVWMGSMALIAAGQAAQGEVPNFIDPDRPDWMAIKVQDGYVYPTGPFHPWFRAQARAAKTAEAVASGELTIEDGLARIGEEASFLGRSRTSLTLGTFLDFAFGENVVGIPTDDWPKYLLQRYLPVPIGYRGLAQQYLPEALGGQPLAPQTQFLTAGLETIGMKTRPFTPAEVRSTRRDSISLERHGAKYDELLTSYPNDWKALQDGVNGGVEERWPGTGEAARERAARRAPWLDDYYTRGEAITAGVNKELSDLEVAWRAGVLTEPFPDLRRRVFDEARGRWEELRAAHKDNLDAIESHDPAVNRFYNQLDEYFKIEKKAADGTFDYEATEAARLDYAGGLAPDDKTRINAYLRAAEDNYGTLNYGYLQYVKDRKTLGYYEQGADRAALDRVNPDIEYRSWLFWGGVEGRKPPALSTVDAVKQALTKVNDGSVQRPVYYEGLQRPISQSSQSQDAWRQSARMVDYYAHDLDADLYNTLLAGSGIKADYRKLTPDLQEDIRETLGGKLTGAKNKLLEAAPDLNAWLVWWGRDIALHSEASVLAYDQLSRRYGNAPIETAQDDGTTKLYEVRYTADLRRKLFGR